VPGKTENIKFLLECGADPNDGGWHSTPSFAIAVDRGYLVIVAVGL
jgi:hypothetical protein